MAICTADRMRQAVEHAAYSGDEDDARYFTWLDGGLVEVEFRCISAGSFDADDYAHNRYGVFRKGEDEPFDWFTVRIDGRV